MDRKFVDLSFFKSGLMEKDGNSDYRYWHNKTTEEKLTAAAEMIKVAYGEPDFLEKKVDRTIFSYRKHAS